MRTRPELSRIIFFGLGFEGTSAIPHFSTHYPHADIIAVDQDAKKFDALQAQPNVRFLAQDALEPYLKTITDPRKTQIIRAPGINLMHPILVTARALKIDHITALGFWLAYDAPTPTLTITGSKGKSTTTALVAHILSGAGCPAYVLGNIGVSPFDEKAAHPKGAVPVVETSSYQISDFIRGGDYHLVGNLYKEHTDWHGTEEAYRRTKFRPFTLDKKCHAIVPERFASYLPADTERSIIEETVKMQDGRLRIYDVVSCPMNEIDERFHKDPLQSNLINALAVVAATGLVKLPQMADNLGRILSTFEGLEHRRETIGNWAGRRWVDDSLATIPEATIMALNQFPNDTIRLVLGGKYRGQDFEHFVKSLNREHGIYIYAFGDSGRTLEKLKPANSFFFEEYGHALEAAFGDSEEDDIIMFSPASPSAPPFPSYKERSAFFKAFGESADESN